MKILDLLMKKPNNKWFVKSSTIGNLPEFLEKLNKEKIKSENIKIIGINAINVIVCYLYKCEVN